MRFSSGSLGEEGFQADEAAKSRGPRRSSKEHGTKSTPPRLIEALDSEREGDRSQ